MTLDLYRALGVRRNASIASIRKAYRTLAKSAHPDAPGGSHEAFNALKLAHDILTDQLARAHYNATGEAKAPDTDQGRGPLMTLISSVLDHVIAQVIQQGLNPAKQDIAEACRVTLESHQGKLRERLAIIKRHQSMYTAIVGRFTSRKPSDDNVMEAIIRGRLSHIEGEIHGVSMSLSLAAEALKIIATYEFQHEAAHTLSAMTIRMYQAQTAANTTGWGTTTS